MASDQGVILAVGYKGHHKISQLTPSDFDGFTSENKCLIFAGHKFSIHPALATHLLEHRDPGRTLPKCCHALQCKTVLFFSSVGAHACTVVPRVFQTPVGM
ncbi:hypothetical protein OIU76_012274 [Salix suchowensis]|nr:hypothetical protein OIU76_012274 [Salix suchowensis]